MYTERLVDDDNCDDEFEENTKRKLKEGFKKHREFGEGLRMSASVRDEEIDAEIDEAGGEMRRGGIQQRVGLALLQPTYNVEGEANPAMSASAAPIRIVQGTSGQHANNRQRCGERSEVKHREWQAAWNVGAVV